MMKVINPVTEESIYEYELLNESDALEKLELADSCFKSWKKEPLAHRRKLFSTLAHNLCAQKQRYAELMVKEVGKPLKEAIGEIEKCAWMVNAYVEKCEQWLASEEVIADGLEHRIDFEPLGVVLSIMPWNYPFWQVLRFATPTMLAGNTTMLKHSYQVPQCAQAIEELFLESGFPKGAFQNIFIDHPTGDRLIADRRVQGVSFTGSTKIGREIATKAGAQLKKVVLELGGSDPFIVLKDADIDKAAKAAVFGRFQNCGQSCIAAKRVFVDEAIVDKFLDFFLAELSSKTVGDPLECDLGPVISQKSLEMIEQQVEDARSKGAKILCGGKRKEGRGFFFEPTVLTDVNEQMRVMQEEVFGPVASVITFKTEEEAISLANSSEYGLGGCLWSGDLKRAQELGKDLESGTIFINSFVKSDPRMPFGGVKNSGLGRELGKYGLLEFVNIKGMNIYE